MPTPRSKKKYFTTLPTNRPPTWEEMDLEAREWGFDTWEDFSNAIDDEIIRREEMAGFELYSTGEVNVPHRQVKEKLN